MGDLVITLTNPGGIMADIMVRPGGGSFIDPGDGSDLGDFFYPPNTTTPAFAFGSRQYSFGDTGLDFWGTAGAIGPNSTIQDATYQASDVSGAPVSLDAIFGNTGTQGDWTLTIGDFAAPDVGDLVSWTLQIETNDLPGPGVPVPATLALFGIGLVGLGWSRRKKT